MNMLWYGGYQGTLKNLTVIQPVPGLPKLHHLTFNDAPAYRTLVAEFDDAVMVVDSPPHQSKLTIQWIHETLKRNVTHLLVSSWPIILTASFLTSSSPANASSP
jgi:hypothetical protein